MDGRAILPIDGLKDDLPGPAVEADGDVNRHVRLRVDQVHGFRTPLGHKAAAVDHAEEVEEDRGRG